MHLPRLKCFGAFDICFVDNNHNKTFFIFSFPLFSLLSLFLFFPLFPPPLLFSFPFFPLPTYFFHPPSSHFPQRQRSFNDGIARDPYTVGVRGGGGFFCFVLFCFVLFCFCLNLLLLYFNSNMFLYDFCDF